MGRVETAERVLDLTLEIIRLLTGEDHTVVKTSDACVIPSSCPRVFGGWDPPSHSRIHETDKILDLTYRIIELLTGEGEDPIDMKMETLSGDEETRVRCDRRWMEDGPVGIQADGPSNETPPDRCRSPPGFRECPEEAGGAPQTPRAEDATNMKVEDLPLAEMYVKGCRRCKEEDVPVDIGAGEYSSFGCDCWAALTQPRKLRAICALRGAQT
ncbi:uncharacterized protein [Eleutherodactylus coqui]|uniref:uncharacterized protein n=1 Tax=Eleutherodactylus coqui TaxID=57060 RepID=UPI003462073B